MTCIIYMCMCVSLQHIFNYFLIFLFLPLYLECRALVEFLESILSIYLGEHESARMSYFFYIYLHIRRFTYA